MERQPALVGSAIQRASNQVAAPVDAALTTPLDRVALKIAGPQHWLSLAVEETSFVLDVLVRRRRDERAATTLLRLLVEW